MIVLNKNFGFYSRFSIYWTRSNISIFRNKWFYTFSKSTLKTKISNASVSLAKQNNDFHSRKRGYQVSNDLT